MRNNCIGMPVSKAMLGFKPIHDFHMLHALLALNKFDPVLDRLPIFLFY